jgi:hypothetical protein
MNLPDKTFQESKRVTRNSLIRQIDQQTIINFLDKNSHTNLKSKDKNESKITTEKENEKNRNSEKLTTSSNQPKKRGRKSKAELELIKIINDSKTSSPPKKACLATGRVGLKKDACNQDNQTTKNKKTSRIANKKQFLDDDELSCSEEEVKKNDGDEEFNLEQEEESEDEDEIDNQDSDFSDESYDNKKNKYKKKSTPKKSSTYKNTEIAQTESNKNEIDSYDINKLVEKWDYELDLESKYFKKPILPNLSEKALIQFLSKNSNKKTVIYECPFCKKIFTYPLVFKIHIFSCIDNKNVPEYLLNCVDCNFMGHRRQEMIKHYLDEHVKDRENKEEKLSECKKSQLEVSRYFYINRNEYKYAFGYLNVLIAKKYKRLKFIDNYFAESNKIKPDFILNYQNFNSETDLKFKLIENNENEDVFILKPFQVHFGFDFKLINLINQVTALSWSHRNYDLNKKCDSQFLAISTVPLNNLNQILNREFREQNHQKYCLQTLFRSKNLIYIYKFKYLNYSTDVKSFGILHDEIGYVSCLKWRPDFGASLTNQPSSNFAGYLLATSSNGNGYIYHINDLTSQSTSQNDSMNIYNPKKEIVLKLSFSFGQCTSADWSQMNGATQIAIGYTNGSVALFHLNSNTLNDLLQFELSINSQNENKMYIYPVKTFNAHLTFVKTLKWSKINNNILASGSLFSREIR